MMECHAWNALNMTFALQNVTGLLSILLYDNTLKHNISWQTNEYECLGEGYQETDTLKVRFIAGASSSRVQPRVMKSIDVQDERSRTRGEVFTPSWVCNEQNNLIDRKWFGVDSIFNTETLHGWVTSITAVSFPEGKNWRDYVLAPRLEVSCGEAPYLTSRYDTVTGEMIAVHNRIGLLDRKLRVITENCGTPKEWKSWATKALQSIYGFDWQGDNVFLARENLLLSVAEAYEDAFHVRPAEDDLRNWAKIISWNIWQMDGLKGTVPNSCQDIVEYDLLGAETRTPCPGCKNNDIFRHTGRYSLIMDWSKRKTIRFVDMMKEVSQ